MALRLVFCVVVLFGAACTQSEERLVNTPQGPVRGYKEDDLFIFYSIPYATAPTGVNKFKAPLPAPEWLEPLEALDKRIICPQPKFLNFTVNKTIQEDCLIANVYVPDTQKTNLPVMVVVHGGGYQTGYGTFLTPKNLVKSKKIIAVTFNYRLGIHGFLCLGTKEAPGNAGMKDQVALLRWVKKNIASFGGNPDDVTIEGYSAGSSSVDLLQLSESTRGLFNKVIPESGANVGMWSIQVDPLDTAKKYAEKHNFDNVDNIYALEEFYRKAPMETIMLDMFIDQTDYTFLFVPCIERDIGEETFLEDTPVNILKDGKYNKVPMLYGFSNMEGLIRINFASFDDWKDKMNKKFSDFLPVDLQFESEIQKEKVAARIKEFYFGDKAVSKETIVGYIDYFTDTMFAYPTLRSVKLQKEAGNNKIYLYEYSFTDKNRPTVMNMDVDIRGADHCAQTAAVFDGVDVMIEDRDESNTTESVKKMKSVIRELWLNFVITGEPVPKGSSLPAWPPVYADGGPHMSLDSTLQLRGPLLERRARFWDDIYERHYRSPVPPPAHPLPAHPPRAHSDL